MLTKKDISHLVYDAILNSKKIQDLIRSIAKDSVPVSISNDMQMELKQLRTKNESLQSQLQTLQQELGRYQEFHRQATPKLQDYNHLAQEVQNLRQTEETAQQTIMQKNTEIKTLSDRLNTAERVVQQYQERFDAPIRYFQSYQSLSESVKSGLENVISGKNELSFLVSCSNEEHLSAIWEYAKEISNDFEQNDFQILTQIFDYFFELFNESLPETKYVRDDVQVGDELDDEYHDRCYGSATSGEITAVILRGYRSKNTGKMIHKSIVKA